MHTYQYSRIDHGDEGQPDIRTQVQFVYESEPADEEEILIDGRVKHFIRRTLDYGESEIKLFKQEITQVAAGPEPDLFSLEYLVKLEAERLEALASGKPVQEKPEIEFDTEDIAMLERLKGSPLIGTVKAASIEDFKAQIAASKELTASLEAQVAASKELTVSLEAQLGEMEALIDETFMDAIYAKTDSRPIYDVNNQFVKNEEFQDTVQRITVVQVMGDIEQDIRMLGWLAIADPKQAREAVEQLLEGDSEVLDSMLAAMDDPGLGRLRQLVANTVRRNGHKERVRHHLIHWQGTEVDTFAKQAISAALDAKDGRPLGKIKKVSVK